ncbi:unnamed protein product [Prorocentrum cordatum]|uniref:Uncharacterized protein n=1 Tax=Prorocentrum cordatum TaxID=2364126 RepID=A0ABN9W2X4_9DINO|nr:unnamed protein product [Polarella glacialis]
MSLARFLFLGVVRISCMSFVWICFKSVLTMFFSSMVRRFLAVRSSFMSVVMLFFLSVVRIFFPVVAANILRERSDNLFHERVADFPGGADLLHAHADLLLERDAEVSGDNDQSVDIYAMM